jgi:hypothetical protein
VAKTYGLWLEDRGITDRATVLIGKDGKVLWSESVGPGMTSWAACDDHSLLHGHHGRLGLQRRSSIASPARPPGAARTAVARGKGPRNVVGFAWKQETASASEAPIAAQDGIVSREFSG